MSHLATQLVIPEYLEDGRVIYAEVLPAASRWLPWPGRTSRWWFEIHEYSPKPIPEARPLWVHVTTHAYTDYGSGGGFTLRACVLRASEGIEKAVEAIKKEN